MYRSKTPSVGRKYVARPITDDCEIIDTLVSNGTLGSIDNDIDALNKLSGLMKNIQSMRGGAVDDEIDELMVKSRQFSECLVKKIRDNFIKTEYGGGKSRNRKRSNKNTKRNKSHLG